MAKKGTCRFSGSPAPLERSRREKRMSPFSHSRLLQGACQPGHFVLRAHADANPLFLQKLERAQHNVVLLVEFVDKILRLAVYGEDDEVRLRAEDGLVPEFVEQLVERSPRLGVPFPAERQEFRVRVDSPLPPRCSAG